MIKEANPERPNNQFISRDVIIAAATLHIPLTTNNFLSTFSSPEFSKIRSIKIKD